MLKKTLCLLMALLLCPMLTPAEESGAGMLTAAEVTGWARTYIARSHAAERLNTGDVLTPDGYELRYDFAVLYADAPFLGVDTAVGSIVLTADTETDPRGLHVGSTLQDVLDAYYHENDTLKGTYEAATLYAADSLPGSAAWAQVQRDGQRVQTVQFAVHDQLSADGYTDLGIIYTLAENHVAAIRVYGLNSCITRDEVSDVMYGVMLTALADSYAMVPFSYNGAELAPLTADDLVFSHLDFLRMTPALAESALGSATDDLWLENGGAGYLRVQAFPGCELTYLYDAARAEGRLYMLLISDDTIEGPRAVRVGDAFSSVYNRFRNGEGEYREDGTELLYGDPDGETFGQAVYGADASATLRYGLHTADGRKVVLQLNFTMMTLTEILLYAE